MYALQGVHTRAANCMYRMGVLVLPMQVGSTVHLYGCYAFGITLEKVGLGV